MTRKILITQVLWVGLLLEDKMISATHKANFNRLTAAAIASSLLLKLGRVANLLRAVLGQMILENLLKVLLSTLINH